MNAKYNTGRRCFDSQIDDDDDDDDDDNAPIPGSTCLPAQIHVDTCLSCDKKPSAVRNIILLTYTQFILYIVDLSFTKCLFH